MALQVSSSILIVISRVSPLGHMHGSLSQMMQGTGPLFCFPAPVSLSAARGAPWDCRVAGPRSDFRPNGNRHDSTHILRRSSGALSSVSPASVSALVSEPCSFARRLQDIETDTGYDTLRRAPEGALTRVSQTAVYDTGGSATSTTPTAFRGGSVVEGVLAREHQRPGARGGERVVVLEVRVQRVSGV